MTQQGIDTDINVYIYMCVCVYIYIYIYIYIYKHTHKKTMYTHSHTHKNRYTCIHTHIKHTLTTSQKHLVSLKILLLFLKVFILTKQVKHYNGFICYTKYK